MALLEQLKKKLQAEGLFDPARKQELPYLPRTIGVVTSPTGAVIRDILHRIADRFPLTVWVAPVRVQGKGAAEEIAAAIQMFNAMDNPPDVIIVARGGGSLEDLWAFNEEIVVRAAADSHIPLISAVGHETDTTLIDFVSDKRAPTPTAAAEMAVPVREELIAYTEELGARSLQAMLRQNKHYRERIQGLSRGLPRPDSLLAQGTQRLDDISSRLIGAWVVRVERALQKVALLGSRLVSPAQKLQTMQQHFINFNERLQHAMRIRLREKNQLLQSNTRLLASLNYQTVLQRGFVLVKDDAGAPITSQAAFATHESATLQFYDGEMRIKSQS
jgi:exodeoxyribonuclease VII large subunit